MIETLSDQVKWRFQTEEFKKDPVGAAKLWLSVGKKCPEIYLDAFLNLMLPYLYPYQVYRVTPEYIDSGSYGTVLTELYSQPPLVHPSRFKGIRNWLDTQIWADGADHFPILRWVFNAGLIIWLMLLSVFSAMYAGRLETVHRSASAGAAVGNVSAGTSGAVEVSISVCLRTAAAFRDTKE